MQLTGKDPAKTPEAQAKIQAFKKAPYNMTEADATRAATEGFDF
jgi:propanediol dehydratase large subunit